MKGGERYDCPECGFYTFVPAPGPKVQLRPVKLKDILGYAKPEDMKEVLI